MKRFYSILFSLPLALSVLCQNHESSLYSFAGAPSRIYAPDEAYAKADSLFSQSYLKLSAHLNFDSAAIARYDKILTYGHQVYIVKIQNITPSLVLYWYPFNTELHSINRNEISQIQYANGTIDIFLPLTDKNGFDRVVVDTARIIIRNKHDWEKVMLTDKPEDIAGMVEKGKVTALYKADFVYAENDYLEKNARIILRKKAANLNTPVVFLVNKNYSKAYGDLPSIELEGVLYNYE